jgi:hypothetical protein
MRAGLALLILIAVFAVAGWLRERALQDVLKGPRWD